MTYRIYMELAKRSLAKPTSASKHKNNVTNRVWHLIGVLAELVTSFVYLFFPILRDVRFFSPFCKISRNPSLHN